MTVMKLKLSAALTALSLTMGASQAEGNNILVNPGFETGSLLGWTTVGTPIVTSAQAHTGSFSVSAFGEDAVRQDFSAVSTSSISEVSFWALRNGGPFDEVHLFYSDSTDTVFAVSGSIGPVFS
jgi:hypothetical protein